MLRVVRFDAHAPRLTVVCARAGSACGAPQASHGVASPHRGVITKLDGTTADYLLCADEYAVGKTELIRCSSQPMCKFGLWVNVKNPRLKVIDWAELQTTQAAQRRRSPAAP